MRFPKGDKKNFEDRTSARESAKHFPLDEAKQNAWRLESAAELGQIRYRRKKEEGTRDFWEKRGLRK